MRKIVLRKTIKGQRDQVLMFSKEILIKLFKDNVPLYNKRLMDYKDPNWRQALWNKFCADNDMDKAAYMWWFKNQRTIYDKMSHMKSKQNASHLTDRQKWLK